MILTDNGKFQDHIEKVVKKVRQKVGWILRSCYTRRTEIIKQLWKSLVQCHIDYCSQLYMPGTAQGMQDIEKLIRGSGAKLWGAVSYRKRTAGKKMPNSWAKEKGKSSHSNSKRTLFPDKWTKIV